MSDCDEWKDAKDAPRDGTWILAWVKSVNHEGYDIVKYTIQGNLPWLGITSCFYEYSNILRWRPLPECPPGLEVKKQHYCKNPNVHPGALFECVEIQDIFYIYTWTETGAKAFFSCTYCPFCGEKKI